VYAGSIVDNQLPRRGPRGDARDRHDRALRGSESVPSRASLTNFQDRHACLHNP